MSEGSGDGWEALPPVAVEALRFVWRPMIEGEEGPVEPVGYEARELSFFPDCWLLRAVYAGESEGFGLYALQTSRGVHPLTGDPFPIHTAREVERFVLQDDSVIDYLVFFCRFTHGDDGSFRVLEGREGMNVTAPPGGELDQVAEDPVDYARLSEEGLEELVHPPRIVSRNEGGEEWTIQTVTQYGASLFRAFYRVGKDGEVEMLGDESLVDEIPIDRSRNFVPEVVRVRDMAGGWPFLSEAEDLMAGQDDDESLDDDEALDDEFIYEDPPPDPLPSTEWRVERWVVENLMEVRLEDALGRRSHEPLLAGLPEDPDEVLEAFAELLKEGSLFVAFEAETPFCEEIVAGILSRRGGFPEVRQRVSSHWGSAFVGALQEARPVLLSLHTAGTVQDVDAFAFELLVKEVPVLLGCDDAGRIPEALRSLVDLELALTRMDGEVFRKAFPRLLDCQWPEGAEEDLEPWVRFVVPQDFFQPLRARIAERRGRQSGAALEPGRAWSAEAALRHIRGRVQSRLTDVDPADSPALEEIEGLGEARVVAHDLVRDIEAAAEGSLAWEEVDRGMLLVGDPGTGKTMLARAMAKAAGVRFLARSTAGWIAGTEDLGQHLAAMRATFSEARRMAPSILFLDEVDSIGNRAKMAGRNRDYCVQVVNALLQQLSGFEERGLVFVVGATNDEEMVDPALRRAGRLDRVVRVPRPNRPALAAILRYHLRPHEEAGRVADDLDPHALAGLALGHTGADVERFVRGAARRARRAGEPIGQTHLMAEITGRPRSDDLLRRLSPEALSRTAVHEAGHALAALLACADPTLEVPMVSIVPRPGGVLGFTSAVGEVGMPRSRRAYEERLEVLLAGRAAESVVYGEENVSTGSGGSASSDLGRATRLAVDMVCRLGMGRRSALRWRARPESDGEISEVRGMLREAHDRVKAKLERNRPSLDRLAELLEDRQEVGAEELAGLDLVSETSPEGPGQGETP